mgnify:CR=1 FL=1
MSTYKESQELVLESSMISYLILKFPKVLEYQEVQEMKRKLVKGKSCVLNSKSWYLYVPAKKEFKI